MIMAKILSSHPALVEAVRAMGIEPDDTRKVIIEITSGEPVRVYVQQIGNHRAPGVVKTLGDANLHVEWGPAPAGGPIDRGRPYLVGDGQPEEIALPVQVTYSPSVSARRTGPGETIVTIHRGDPKEQE